VGDLHFLRQIEWLDDLSGAEWDALEAQATRHAVAAGAIVFEPERDPRSVFLLERGRVRIYRLSASGDEATLGYVAPREVFGELSGFGEFPRESFAVATLASTVWKVPVALFRALIQSRPRLGIAVTRQMGARMKRVESRVESLIFRDVRCRLALALIELAEDGARLDGDSPRLEVELTQSELATVVGASRQSVNAEIARFRADGWVERRGRRLALLEPTRLAALAGSGGDAPAPGPTPGR
jgi:CRP-like cAMP-binding protein